MQPERLKRTKVIANQSYYIGVRCICRMIDYLFSDYGTIHCKADAGTLLHIQKTGDSILSFALWSWPKIMQIVPETPCDGAQLPDPSSDDRHRGNIRWTF